MNVLEELIEFESQIDRAHLERRIEDWRYRIQRLYTQITAWLPAGWSAMQDGDVVLRDELMLRFGVPEQFLPVLRLDCGGATRARLEPRALWIIGANGRVDLTFVPPRKHFVITDRADNFEVPDWRIYDLLERTDEPLTCESLLASLK